MSETNKKYLEQSVGDEAYQTATLQKITSVGLFKCDLKGNCEYLNNYIMDLLGVPVDQNALDVLTEAIHIDDQMLFFEAWDKMLEDKQQFSIDFRLTSTQDNLHRVHCEVIPCLDGNKKIEAILGILVDNTQLFRAEEFMRLHHWKLDKIERFYNEDETLASITHELTQPMSVISIYIQRSLDRLHELNIEDRALFLAMNKIKKLIDRSTRILNDVRGFFNTNDLKLNKATFDQMIQHALETLNGNFISRINIICERQSPPQVLLVDDFQIEQVIVNLVKNACEAMSELSREHSSLSLKTYSHEDWTYLSISDTGAGIPLDIQANIFKPFTTSKARGMGMGLPISRSICQAHGGELILEESSLDGTTFVIKLPIGIV